MDFGAYAMTLADNRRAAPQDVLTTALVQAEVDGERLTSSEIASFFMLLAIAGNETTRNAISHGVLAFTRYPDERTKWWADYDDLAPLGRRGDRALGVAGDLHAPHAHQGHRAERHHDGRRRQGDDVVLLRQPRRSAIRQPVDVRHRAWTPTPMSGSAVAARTSASVRTWPVARSRWRSMNCTAGYRTSKSPRNRRACCRISSTASSACWWPGHPRTEPGASSAGGRVCRLG